MAIIGKIRQRSGLLIAVIGIAMLAFILGEFFQNAGGGPQDFRVGEIYGEEIDKRDYDRRVNRQLEAIRSTGQQPSTEDIKQIEDQVWNQMIRERIFSEEFEKLGIVITKEEFDDIRFGENILPEFKQDQTFINPETGRFDPQMMRQYFETIQTRFPLFWEMQRDRILETRKGTKYNNMVKGGVYANSLQAARDYRNENQKVDFRFVLKRYSDISDEDISYSESDVEKYYSEVRNDAKFKQDPSRTIEYLEFKVDPSERDIENQRENMEKIAERFRSTTNDTMFFTSNTNKRFAPQEYREGSLDPELDSLILNGEIGDVVGPYQEGNVYKVTKIITSGEVPEVNARHILIKPEGEQTIEDAMARAEDLKRQIKGGADFAALATEFSEDFGSAQNGGDLDWFGEGQMVPAFNDACFEGKVGDMPIVETQFGVHLIEILDRRATEKLEVATIEKEIRPSKESFDKVYDVASTFAINNDNPERFKSAAEEQGLRIRTAEDIKESDRNVRGLPESRSIVRWAFDNETGAISQPMEIEKRFVIAHLTKIKEGGVPKLDDIRERLMTDFKKKLKYELYSGKMSGINSIDEVAVAADEEVLDAQGIAFSTNAIPGGGGNEPYVIGKVFTLEPGQISVPLKGETGVYVVELTNKTEAPELENYADNKEKVRNKVATRVDFEVYRALEKNADVKDERARFF